MVYFDCINKNIYLHKNHLASPGIEPGSPAWQASILPLNQRCFLLGVLTKLGHMAMLNVGQGHMVCVSPKTVPQSVGFEPTLPEGN